MPRLSAAIFFVGLIASAASADVAQEAPYNWGTETADYTNAPEFAGSKAICRRLGAPRVPVADRPSPAQARALGGCDSGKLYYGIGVKPDYVRARHCAIVEGRGDGNQRGLITLMQVYANGRGVKRNSDLATAFACAIRSAPMESVGRVAHLQQLGEGEEFDFCDDITSGYAMGFCAGRASEQAKAVRDADIAAIVAGLPAGARALFPPLRTAFDGFVDAHGLGEVDLSGTDRGAVATQAEDTTRDQFLKDLQRLRAGHWLAAAPGDARVADDALNASYRKALAWAATKANYGTITPDSIRAAQRAWLAYRDAYLRFAAAAAPGLPREAVLARLTRLRLAQLDGLVAE